MSVHVLDRNEFAPALRRRHYRGRVSEAAPAGALVGDAEPGAELGAPLVLLTDDADSPANRQRAYEILQPGAAALFRVDPTTGALHLLAPLDYERAASHEFSVRVSRCRRERPTGRWLDSTIFVVAGHRHGDAEATVRERR